MTVPEIITVTSNYFHENVSNPMTLIHYPDHMQVKDVPVVDLFHYLKLCSGVHVRVVKALDPTPKDPGFDSRSVGHM